MRWKAMLTTVLVLVLSGVAFAQPEPVPLTWQEEYDAWRALPDNFARFQTAEHDRVYALATTATAADLSKLISDLEAMVYNVAENENVRRGAADVLIGAYGNAFDRAEAAQDGQGLTVVVDKVKTLCIAYTEAPLNSWAVMSFKTTHQYLRRAMTKEEAKVFVLDLVTRLSTQNKLLLLRYRRRDDCALAVTYARAALTPADVIIYVQTRWAVQDPVQLTRADWVVPQAWKYLAKSYARGKLPSADYEAVLKRVITESIGCMNEMEVDDPERVGLLTAISRVKTSLKQLREVEGTP